MFVIYSKHSQLLPADKVRVAQFPSGREEKVVTMKRDPV